MKQLKVTHLDLYKIYEDALDNFRNSATKQTDPNSFVAKSYLEAVRGFLYKNDIKVELVYDDRDWKTVDKKD